MMHDGFLGLAATATSDDCLCVCGEILNAVDDMSRKQHTTIAAAAKKK